MTKHVHEVRNKVSFEEWKKNYEDIPYIKENYKKIHEDYGIPFECINGGKGKECFREDAYYELSPYTTICLRVFKHGGFYEICLNSQYYLMLGNEDWLEDSPDLIEKELYEWCNGEIFNTDDDPHGLESVTDNDYDEDGNWRHE